MIFHHVCVTIWFYFFITKQKENCKTLEIPDESSCRQGPTVPSRRLPRLGGHANSECWDVSDCPQCPRAPEQLRSCPGCRGRGIAPAVPPAAGSSCVPEIA